MIAALSRCRGFTGSRCAPPSGSSITSSTRPSCLRRSAVRFRASAAASFLSCALPEDRRAAFRRDHRVGAVLEHQQPVAHADGERAARAALARHDADDRHASADISNRLRAMASLWPRSSAPTPGIGALRVDKVMSGKPKRSASRIRRSALR